jgi:hypothetical protein
VDDRTADCGRRGDLRWPWHPLDIQRAALLRALSHLPSARPAKPISVILCFMRRHSIGWRTYTNKAAWQSSAGSYSTITFAELPNVTWITDQYSNLGVP